MKSSTSIRIAIVVLTLGVSLQAAVVPGRWEKVDTLSAGEGIVVMLKSGERLEGVFGASGTQGIEFTTQSGDQLNLQKSAIARILRAEKSKDPTTNGALIGTGAGFGIGFGSLVAVAAKNTASGPVFDGESVGLFILGGIAGAGIGALLGTAFDAMILENEVLYRAP